MSKNGKPELFTTQQQQLGVVYAKALLGVGETSGNTDSLLQELEVVAEALSKSPKFGEALLSPQLGSEDKIPLIDRIFGGKVDPQMLNFLKVLVSKGRFDCLPAISAAAKKLSDQKNGQIQATLTTAQEVDGGVCDAIAEELSKKLGKAVKLSSTVDASIVGGIVVRVGDTVYDSSVVGQLQQVRQRAIERATEAIREKLERFTSEA